MCIPYFILTDSTMSHRGMSRDSDKYPETEVFNPERYMGTSDDLDPKQFVFGFGRR